MPALSEAAGTSAVQIPPSALLLNLERFLSSPFFLASESRAARRGHPAPSIFPSPSTQALPIVVTAAAAATLLPSHELQSMLRSVPEIRDLRTVAVFRQRISELTSTPSANDEAFGLAIDISDRLSEIERRLEVRSLTPVHSAPQPAPAATAAPVPLTDPSPAPVPVRVTQPLRVMSEGPEVNPQDFVAIVGYINRFLVAQKERLSRGAHEPIGAPVRLSDAYYLASCPSDGQTITLTRREFRGTVSENPKNIFDIKLNPDRTVQSIRDRTGTTIPPDRSQEILHGIKQKVRSEIEPPVPNMPDLSREQLLTFRAATIAGQVLPKEGEKTAVKEVKLGDKAYLVWILGLQDGGFAINIQEDTSYETYDLDRKIGIRVNNRGEILSVYEDSMCVSTLSGDKRDLLEHCMLNALETSSIYVVRPFHLDITTVSRGPSQLPWFHLDRLSRGIDAVHHASQDLPRIMITFKNDDLSNTPGRDAGGLSRTYLDDLFEGIVRDWHIPKDRRNFDLFTPMPAKGNEGKYRSIGKVFMWCFESKAGEGQWDQSYITGDRFHPGVFNAALSLTREHLTQKPLSVEALFAMRSHLLEALAQKEPASEWGALDTLYRYGNSKAIETLRQQLLREEDLSSRPALSPAEREELRVLRSMRSTARLKRIAELIALDEDFLPVAGAPTGDQIIAALSKPPVKNTANDKETIDKFTELLNERFKNQKQVEEFVDERFRLLPIDYEAIREIAVGMQSYQKAPASWEEVRSCPYVQFCGKVQGGINRDLLARSLHIVDGSPAWLHQKVQHIRDWILNETTPDVDVRTFLKWTTGATGITERGVTFGIAHNPAIPLDVYTCSSTILVSEGILPELVLADHPYETKDGFIFYVQDAMRNHGFGKD